MRRIDASLRRKTPGGGRASAASVDPVWPRHCETRLVQPDVPELEGLTGRGRRRAIFGYPLGSCADRHPASGGLPALLLEPLSLGHGDVVEGPEDTPAANGIGSLERTVGGIPHCVRRPKVVAQDQTGPPADNVVPV